MDYEYLSKIKAAISLYTRKRTSNVLEGDFRSVYQGRSLDFDELREYSFGDNVHDIDWKSSSRTGKTLIRKYVANKRHNILFIGDTGPKMMADTTAGEAKKELALTVFGTIAYLVDRQGTDFALLHGTPKGIDFSFFHSGNMHLEKLMETYDRDIEEKPSSSLYDLLAYTIRHIRRKMVIFLLTDLEGMIQLDDALLKEAGVNNDIFVINIEDAYLTQDYAYDMDEGQYADHYLTASSMLQEAELAQRQQMMDQVETMFKRNRVDMVTIGRGDQVIDQIIALFERHRTGSEDGYIS